MSTEIVIIAVLFVGSVLLLARNLLGKAGVGRPNGKPDCGCGRCAEKRRRKPS